MKRLYKYSIQFTKKSFLMKKIILILFLWIFCGTAFTQTSVFTSSGTWTCPQGVTSVTVECWGGGGAGGAGGSANGQPGGGGAGGQYVKKENITVTPGVTYTVSVATAQTVAGGNGNDSWFMNNTTVLAKGGEGGKSYALLGTGGLGSTAGGIGDVVYRGGSGADMNLPAKASGAGGGGAGSNGNGGDASGMTAGIGATQGGGNGGAGITGNSGNGRPGFAYGGGGSGAIRTGIAGFGASGCVKLTFTCPVTTIADAGPDQAIISSSTFMQGNTPIIGTGLWTKISGSGTITDPNNPISGVTGLAAGTIAVFRWTISNGDCPSSSDDVVISRYCTVTGSSAAFYFTNVKFNTIDRTSVFDSPGYINTGESTTVKSGNSYDLDVTFRNQTAGTYTLYTAAWIDFNGNGSFSDPGEYVMASSGVSLPSLTNANRIENITIPTTASVGLAKMRVVVFYGSITGPCDATNLNIEWEDYDINIICASQPTASNVSRCGPGTVTLTAQGAETGESYRWYSAPVGGTLLYTGSSYTTPVISSTTSYYVAKYRTSDGCESQPRIEVKAIINNSTPVIVAQPANNIGICMGTTAVFSIGVSEPGCTFQWRLNGVDIIPGGNFHVDVNTGTLIIFEVYPDDVGFYDVIVSNSCSPPSDTSVTAILSLPATLSPGTYSIGPSGYFSSIGAAIHSLQCGGVIGSYIFELQSAYSSTIESYPLAIPFIPGVSHDNTITIRPAAGVTGKSISSSNSRGTILLDGGSYVIFDGRPGGIGTAKQLTIENTHTDGFTVKYENDASYNILRHLTIRGVCTSIVNGVVYFGTSTGATGNDFNTIEYCDIRDGATTPTNMIFAWGTEGVENDNNTISNCNIYNFFSTTTNHQGIFIYYHNREWTIQGNSIYQTSSRVQTKTTAIFSTGIWILNSTGYNFNITNNYIGGTAPLAGGTPWTISGTAENYIFYAIDYTGSPIANSTIQNNVIRNFSWIGKVNNPGTLLWSGITLSNGNIDCDNNIIGNATGTNNITVTLQNCANLIGFTSGIFSTSKDIVNIRNNIIGSITTSSTVLSVAHGLKGIEVQGTSGGPVEISGNIIGSATTSNSINASYNPTSSPYVQNIQGIFSSHVGSVLIKNNTIANWNNAYTPATSFNILSGIKTTDGSNVISWNNVYNLTTPNQGTNDFDNANIIGIINTSTASPVMIDHNRIYSLSNTSATANVQIFGIANKCTTTPGSKVTHNVIFSLSTTSTGASVNVNGIGFDAGSCDYVNNMIRLGIDASGNSQTANFVVNGIKHGVNATAPNNIYFNSIYIGGTGILSSSNITSCYRKFSTTGNVNVLNNIFFNARSNASGTGKHYCIHAVNSSAVPSTSDYNNLSVSGTGGTVGFNGADRTTLALWRTATGKDMNSVSLDPYFKNATGSASTFDLHIDPAYCNMSEKGIPIPGYNTDFDDEERDTQNPDIGADEYIGYISSASATAACNGGSTTLEITNYIGSIQWQTSASNSPYTWVNILGANSATYTTPNLTTTTYYRGEIINGSCVAHTNDVAVSIVNEAPSNPGAISGPVDVCLFTSGNVYSVTPVSGSMVTYNWTIPTGASITSGQGTNSITVTFGANSGNISVYASNVCGTTTTSTLAVSVGGPGTWCGKVNTLWSVGANWCGGKVPNSTTNVVIPASPPNQPKTDRTILIATCKNLTINEGATLWVHNDMKNCSNGIGWGVWRGGVLHIYGNLTNNGTMIHSSSHWCSYFTYLKGIGSISGNGSYLCTITGSTGDFFPD
jgi:hypothetical protein